ncbi:hypothetical protein RchiOBHm_Chr2g0096181 [Rosa chinensis]|uniref:Uncharacterized protein n=1 Tax=Rosa chinensis TaxID=74649 RepID=A0A2P6RL19_ROSCH|nr:hypothetical protein RchiOBHm_Chr2g0096181 [Rosa chinensis]
MAIKVYLQLILPHLRFLCFRITRVTRYSLVSKWVSIWIKLRSKIPFISFLHQ